MRFYTNLGLTNGIINRIRIKKDWLSVVQLNTRNVALDQSYFS